jgi:hypothetical protein
MHFPTHRSRTSVQWTRTTVNALHLVVDMELLVLMTTTRVDRRLVVTARVVTTGSARLVADRMTTTAEGSMDDVHHRETRMDHRYRLDENHMATTHTTEVGRHHLGAMVLTLTREMEIRMSEGQGVHGEATEVAIQPMRDTGEAPPSPIYDSVLLASIESHFL